MPPPAPLRLLVADDQTIARTGLVKILEDDPRLDVVGVCSDGETVVEQCLQHRPDVVLLDARLSLVDAIEATRQIIESGTAGAVVVMSAVNDDGRVLPALQAGAAGFLRKDTAPAAIIAAVIAVSLGDQVLSGSAAGRMLDLATGGGSAAEQHESLTPRELEILRCIAAGASNKQIAGDLQISDKTVRNHVSHLYEKLDIYDRSQAVLYALRAGLAEL